MVRFRGSTTSISALFLSVWLATMIPLNFVYAATWKERFFVIGHDLVPNYMMPTGFANLGIVMIGWMVLWAGFRKNDRWAWLVMLVILLCFFVPDSSLPMYLRISAENRGSFSPLSFFAPFTEEGWWHCLPLLHSSSQVVGTRCISVVIQTDILRFLMATIALLLPIKKFFWNKHAPAVRHENVDRDNSLPADSK